MAWKKSASRLFTEQDQERVLTDLRVFFGPRSEKYIEIYERMRASGGKTYFSWSWPVFFGGFVWFFYRKMYWYGAFTILLPFVAAVLLGATGVGGGAAVFAGIAKPAYIYSALARIEKADLLGLSDAERVEYLTRSGCVSLTAGILGGALFALLAAAAIYDAATSGAGR
jgi:hypothetical protein